MQAGAEEELLTRAQAVSQVSLQKGALDILQQGASSYLLLLISIKRLNLILCIKVPRRTNCRMVEDTVPRQITRTRSVRVCEEEK